jgi:hypothetical protein
MRLRGDHASAIPALRHAVKLENSNALIWRTLPHRRAGRQQYGVSPRLHAVASSRPQSGRCLATPRIGIGIGIAIEIVWYSFCPAVFAIVVTWIADADCDPDSDPDPEGLRLRLAGTADPARFARPTAVISAFNEIAAGHGRGRRDGQPRLAAKPSAPRARASRRLARTLLQSATRIGCCSALKDGIVRVPEARIQETGLQGRRPGGDAAGPRPPRPACTGLCPAGIGSREIPRS